MALRGTYPYGHGLLCVCDLIRTENKGGARALSFSRFWGNWKLLLGVCLGTWGTRLQHSGGELVSNGLSWAVGDETQTPPSVSCMDLNSLCLAPNLTWPKQPHGWYMGPPELYCPTWLTALSLLTPPISQGEPFPPLNCLRAAVPCELSLLL